MKPIYSNIQDEITFQMGLNLRLYQEIEQIMKRLISTSSQTIQITTLRDNETKVFDKPKLDLWSNRVNLEKTTLGNLLPQLEQTKNESSFKQNQEQEIDGIQVSASYDIPVIEFFDMPEFEQGFKQIVSDRNQFIHHFQSISNQDDELLNHLKESYQRAEQFKKKHLIPYSEELKKCIDEILKQVPEFIEEHFENWNRLTAYLYFEEIYHQHKRADGWIAWAVLMQEMHKNYPNILNGLRQESSFISKHTAWTKIIQDIYPQWQFMEEITAKDRKQLLVKIDNSMLKLKNNTIVDIEN